MGKNFCKVDKKWCKFLKRTTCLKANCELDCINRCPRLAEIETTRLSDILKEVTFDEVFARLCQWYPSQEKSRGGYQDVFSRIFRMIPQKHKYDDLFIEIKKVIDDYDGREYPYVHGIPLTTNDKKTYSLELTPWNEIISMYITQETLDSLTKEEIVASCLYEMTFHGFNEDTIGDFKESLMKSIKEIKA